MATEHYGTLSSKWLPSAKLLSLNINGVNLLDASRICIERALQARGGYVCLANVHMLIEAYQNPEYARIIDGADLALPDGRPLVVLMKLLGIKTQKQVRGADLTREICCSAEQAGVSVGFLGAAPETLERLIEQISKNFPHLSINYAYSPPFRPLSEDEWTKVVSDINQSGSRILFVGLGCPRQERWMAKHSKRSNTVMLGVGAAFDFLAGTVPEAPKWMQNAGLEWIFRLSQNPKRLWKRYAVTNSKFIGLLLLSLIRMQRAPLHIQSQSIIK